MRVVRARLRLAAALLDLAQLQIAECWRAVAAMRAALPVRRG